MIRQTEHTESRPRPPRVFLTIIKLLQVILLFGVLGALVFGVIESGMTLLHLAKGIPVEGQVTTVEQSQRPPAPSSAFAPRRGAPVKFPVVAFSWPPDSDSRKWIQSLIPREDLRRGDTVTVRIIPGYENLARADRSPLYYMIVAAALFGGLLFAWIMGSSWYAIDASFGRAPEGGISIFHGVFGKAMVAAIVIPVGAVTLFHLYFVPWMQLNEYVAFADRPGRLLHLAAQRGGPPRDGPMNTYERRLLEIPGLRIGISQDALNRADSSRDADTIRRYIAAIKDPDIPFSVDMRRAPERFADGPPDLLRLFLETGIELPDEAKRAMLEVAERPSNADALAILAEYGITRAALVQ